MSKSTRAVPSGRTAQYSGQGNLLHTGRKGLHRLPGYGSGGNRLTETARRCFEFVRDKIRHSWDYRLAPVTCRASDVLEYGTGCCYAKSHLLAALPGIYALCETT